MFDQDDFFKLLKYFKDGTTTGIDPNLIISAENSKAKSTTLFNENIDMQCFSTDDWKRLKEFLIRWYATHRTFVSTGRHANDVRSLPDSDVNQLMNSFGYTEGLGEITTKNKVDLFYDLVNLYKLKGTPYSVEKILSYFGISNVEIIEYWLQYDNDGALVFRPENITNSDGTLVTSQNLNFHDITDTDPHWMLTESQINNLFNTNKIAFPSKSPYFGIRPTVELSGLNINPSLAILIRFIQDQYAEFIAGTGPVKNITSQSLSLQLSLLDLYLGTVYTFNEIYNKTIDSSDLSFLCYNGSLALTNEEIIEYYDTISKRKNSLTRTDLEANRILYQNTFTRLRTTNFLTNLTTAGVVLSSCNADLKTIIDTYFLSGKEDEILNILIRELSSWIQNNINNLNPNLLSLIFGFGSLEYLRKVINFFKPYRSRLILVEQIYVIDNPLMDSVTPDDVFNDIQTDIFIDFDTADSLPGFAEDYIPTGIYVTSTPPIDETKRILEIYLDSTGDVKCVYDDSTANIGVSTYVTSNPGPGQYRVYNIYLEDLLGSGKQLTVISDDTPELTGGVATRVVSNPPPSYYQINDIYLNQLNQFTIIYDGDPIFYPADSTARIYYSRITVDCGSYFDIGASCDLPTKEPDIYIDENIYDFYNSHIGDGTSSVHFEYSVDSTSEDVIEVLTDGGWESFDEGWMFDSPAFSDVCHIQVTDL